MDNIFNPRKVNSYSLDELFELCETGVVTLEELETTDLHMSIFDELEKRIQKFRKVKELDDWNSVKDSGIEELTKFVSKNQSPSKYIHDADVRIRFLRELDFVKKDIEKEIENKEYPILGEAYEGFLRIEERLKELLYNSSSEERKLIQTKLDELHQILALLKDIFRIINPRRNELYSIVPHHERTVNYCIVKDTTDWLDLLSPASYTPPRLSESFSWSFFNKGKTLCNSAVFAPASIAKGDDLFVQVYIYKDEETDKVIIDSKMSDEDTTQRSYTPLNFPIKKGDKISIRLDMHGLSVEGDSTKSIIWQNKYTKCSFFVYVPINYDKPFLFS